ncbi:MAG: PilZ domain-containing protein [Candidatus Omnitrophota bacterium]
MRYNYKKYVLRRSCARYKIETSAKVVGNGQEEKPLILKDISSRGVGVFSGYSFTPNAKIKIIFTNPFSQETLCRIVRVAWAREVNDDCWEAGLDFGIDNIICFSQES